MGGGVVINIINSHALGSTIILKEHGIVVKYNLVLKIKYAFKTMNI